jgi:HAD superfamily hydrolase (TIGR01509 family)
MTERTSTEQSRLSGAGASLRQSVVPEIRAVLFDMDGVLVDSERLIAEAAKRMFADHYGLEVKLEDFVPFVGAGENRYLGGVAENYGIHIDIDTAKAWTYEIYGQLARARALGMRAIPGAVDYVRACRTHGLKTALASAADKVKVMINLEYLGLRQDEFDAVLTAEDVTHKKPDPEMYLKAAERLAVGPECCLVVEDAVNGTIAGVRAGARVLGITSSFTEEALKKAGAAWTASDLACAPFPWELMLSPVAEVSSRRSL